MNIPQDELAPRVADAGPRDAPNHNLREAEDVVGASAADERDEAAEASDEETIHCQRLIDFNRFNSILEVISLSGILNELEILSSE